jgi:transcriptional regulator GlxA family with amidase domain
MAISYLDAALRIWDIDQAQAKSQIKVAAALLRGDADDPPVREKPTDRIRTGLQPWQAGKVREFIDGSLESKIRLQDCASKARLSASHFSRAFKVTFVTTVINYIQRRRVERAQQMMLLSDQPLSQIAVACGFADQAHYCRVFRDVIGLSPNAWRRENMLKARRVVVSPDNTDATDCVCRLSFSRRAERLSALSPASTLRCMRLKRECNL